MCLHGTTHVVRKAGAFRHSHIKHRQWVLHWTLKLAMLGGIEQLVYQQWPKGRLPIRNFAARSRDARSTDGQVGREVFHVLQLFENGRFRSHRASLATAKRQYVNGCALRCDLLLLTFRCRGVRRRRHGWLCLRRGQACKCWRLNSALSQSIFAHVGASGLIDTKQRDNNCICVAATTANRSLRVVYYWCR